MTSHDDPEHADRMAQLESKLAFLEHTVDVLAGELESQQNEARILHRKLDALHRQLESLQDETGIEGQADERPPHY
ncbi:SlyX family protein [Wenzhouxiangella marina]|uniref:Uncharacterized protein n=1 Tax=Wenzhouxiangella marina TaxID=1579979 RepID=A0A0K0XVV9_9GAMM|nr:SlyX family protein [Wenzhouxiangella marina]AKS41751.1 hypothetical protein WM2015_1379 [Wenzhouxiangella marina]MBB6086487.1 putative coiled-coil protein SlyX [Wenzhouxiangella marina]